MRVYAIVGVDRRTLTYEEFLSLWLNVDAHWRRFNFNSAVAAAVANGSGRMVREWITAAVDGEAKQQEWRNWDAFRFLSD